MTQELGKIERPSVESFKGARKLFFIPLVFSPRQLEGELLQMVFRYWDQVESQLTGLELKLGSVKKVYHELVPSGGDEGSKIIEELNSTSYEVVRSRLERGAQLEGLEDTDLLTESMDWTRCLAMGLQNEKVFSKVYEFYTQAQNKRNEHIAKRIDETLKEGECGVLLMREGHHVQFPPDIEVFYVSPPGLDEIKRWLRTKEMAPHPEGAEGEPE
ncbi:MAG: hypothetical protein FJ004_03610 [Chloroflexi bacterium]|nr:hypothetical protein [Chloroflexota bacterium]